MLRLRGDAEKSVQLFTYTSDNEEMMYKREGEAFKSTGTMDFYQTPPFLAPVFYYNFFYRKEFNKHFNCLNTH